ncbi:Aldo/keto reductase [Basidiobolus meristosporus CBS 931.73]|uniref:Aldo/keto reductase n=1 Tax=Basidiobolus meristosporus CBS 931.73 TaxID=1314790 RepID=A0A1Y1YPI2_9FUNG|nr:Aldo/keto reductase [Basidiobolus meristosporus CBS 931.73]ORX99912.1 Aldo/keto reductase [Basidiobolus meristosporus CBS 931.73]|eukprot:ORX63386.1 Aldo/keto reductase [Basidiobolus meristosporus CBS 931.73]
MPSIGLGTYRVKDPELVKNAISSAVKAGYRLIDSATVYKNEEIIGQVIHDLLEDQDLKLKREDLFITSKLAPKDQGYEKCYQAVESSLKRFNLEYLDLYLIHWPGTQKLRLSDPQNLENRIGSWKALEKLYKEGKLRSIGISNYTVKHVQEILEYAEIAPMVAQFEMHPLLYQEELMKICQSNGIQVQAYSSFGEGRLVNGELVIDEVEAIAKNHQLSVGQVLLKWGLQHGAVVIPKSVTPERIQQNLNVGGPELSKQEMAILDGLSSTEMRTRFCWDPTDIF